MAHGVEAGGDWVVPGLLHEEYRLQELPFAGAKDREVANDANVAAFFMYQARTAIDLDPDALESLIAVVGENAIENDVAVYRGLGQVRFRCELQRDSCFLDQGWDSLLLFDTWGSQQIENDAGVHIGRGGRLNRDFKDAPCIQRSDFPNQGLSGLAMGRIGGPVDGHAIGNGCGQDDIFCRQTADVGNFDKVLKGLTGASKVGAEGIEHEFGGVPSDRGCSASEREFRHVFARLLWANDFDFDQSGPVLGDADAAGGVVQSFQVDVSDSILIDDRIHRVLELFTGASWIGAGQDKLCKFWIERAVAHDPVLCRDESFASHYLRRQSRRRVVGDDLRQGEIPADIDPIDRCGLAAFVPYVAFGSQDSDL